MFRTIISLIRESNTCTSVIKSYRKQHSPPSRQGIAVISMCQLYEWHCGTLHTRPCALMAGKLCIVLFICDFPPKVRITVVFCVFQFVIVSLLY